MQMRYNNLILLVFVLCLLFGGCGRSEVSPLSRSGQTPDGFELRSGDIILGRTSGFLPAVAASLGKPVTDFSHAGVYFIRDQQGMIMHMQPTGLQVVSPEYFYSKYHRVGVVRFGDVSEIGVDSACLALWQRHLREPVVADFTGSETQAEDGSMFCLTLINNIYESAGHKPPFEKQWKFSDDRLVLVLASIAGATHEYGTAVAAVFHNPEAKLVHDWTDPEYDIRNMHIDNAVVAQIRKIMGQGYMIRQPVFYTRLWIDALMPLKGLAELFVSPGLRKMLRQVRSGDELAAMYMLNKFVKGSRHLILAQLVHSPDIAIDQAAENAADKLQNQFFTKSVRNALIYPQNSYCTR